MRYFRLHYRRGDGGDHKDTLLVPESRLDDAFADLLAADYVVTHMNEDVS